MVFSFQAMQQRFCSRLTQAISLSSLTLASCLLIGGNRAIAAEEVVLTYGLFGRTVPVEDLRVFAETGETSAVVDTILDVTKLNPETVRTMLKREVGMGLMFLDRTLNTLPAEYVLFQTGQVVHSSSRQANIQALRAAMVLSASDDNRVSVLEFLDNYPLQQLYIDGFRLAKVARDVNQFISQVEDRFEVPLAVVKDFLASLVCDCEAPAATTVTPDRDTGIAAQ